MTLDEIRTAFETAEGLPAQALTSAVAQASALAPEVIALIDKAVAGVFLMPKQEELLFFGLHALAAAGETSVYRPLVALLRLPEWQVDRLLGDASTTTAVGMLLALYDGDADALFAAIDDRATDGAVRWGLFQVIARLTWEGRISRERTIELLDRFDREELADADDVAWIGWQDAIMYLGIEEMEPRVRRAWKSGRAHLQREVDQREWRHLLRKAVASPEDPQIFINDHIQPITDPVASLRWLDKPAPKVRRKAYGEPADPAEELKLTPGEISWLGDFLMSDQAPSTGMTLEMIDGFFTAIISRSDSAQLSAHLPRIWGEDGEGPDFDSPEQADFVADLLTRHWSTIALRSRAGVPHRPGLSWSDPEDKGRQWAAGFTVAMSFEPDVWTSVLEGEEAGPFLAPILSLIADEYDEEAEPIPEEYRAAIVAALPDTVVALSHYFRHGTVPPMAAPAPVARRLSNEPVRVTKVGRNEPCPCGSGRKYKKCCGATA